MNARIRNNRLAVAVIRVARRLRLAQSEAERRHAIAEKARQEVHGPPMTDQEYEEAVKEVEARRQ